MTDRQGLLKMLADYNRQWDRAHKRYLQHGLSEDHEAMFIARRMIDRINAELDQQDLMAAE
jgi:hypothetical protein